MTEKALRIVPIASRAAATALALVMASGLPASAQTSGQSAEAWEEQLRLGDRDAPAWDTEQAQARSQIAAQSGSAPIPPRLPANSRPWPQSGGGEAAGRIGLPGSSRAAEQTPQVTGSAPGQPQALGANRRTGDNPVLRDTGLQPLSDRAGDDALRLRRLGERRDEDSLVPNFDQETGAGFARATRNRVQADEGDPYAPLGVRVGTFTLLPAFEVRGGLNSEEGGDDSAFLRLQPELRANSDWSRHALRGAFSLRHDSFEDDAEEDETTIDASIGGRIDINRDTTLDVELGFERDRVSPIDPDLPATALEETSVDTLSLTASLARRFGRVIATIRGEVGDYSYDDTRLAGGSIADTSEQDFREYEAGLRLDYDITDRLGVFVEGDGNVRDFDTEISSGGRRLGSDGFSVLAGMTANNGKLDGELGLGYQRQSFDDTALDAVDALLVRGSLVWQASGLTSVTLSAESEIDETIGGTEGGFVVYALRAGVAHALRRNLLLDAGVGFEQEDDNREVTLEAGMEYRINRSVAIVGDIEHRFEDNDGADEDETTVSVGLRLQR